MDSSNYAITFSCPECVPGADVSEVPFVMCERGPRYGLLMNHAAGGPMSRARGPFRGLSIKCSVCDVTRRAVVM